MAVCHFVFIYRVRKAQSLAASIRAEDLRRFETLLASEPGGVDPGTFRPSRTSNPLTNGALARAEIQSVGVVIQRSTARATRSQIDEDRTAGERDFRLLGIAGRIAAHAATSTRLLSRQLCGTGLARRRFGSYV